MSFRRKIGGERAMLMLPFNVVLVGRVRGSIDPSEVSIALATLRLRHPLLSVRVQLEEDGAASFVSHGTPDITVNAEKRRSSDQWLESTKQELQTPFPIETGPLVRCTLLRAEEVCEIVLCAHHIVCDGMSLGYLLRDLLRQLSKPAEEQPTPVIPPAIDRTTVPDPPTMGWFARSILGGINRRWARKRIRFAQSDASRMHEEFWRKNRNMTIRASALEAETTAQLALRCRTESVTVNSALWTAFLAAQHDVQKDRKAYRRHSALAVNTRDRLRTPAGESFGFFASSLTVNLPYVSDQPFWNNARTVHSRITKKLSANNLFRMLSSELIHPTLLDSLYFHKYGLLRERWSGMLLRRMGWHKVTYGCALTNVGRFDIPTLYGPLELVSVHGPLFYSDVEEKMIGVITVGGRLTLLMAVHESVSDLASALMESSLEHLKKAIDG